MQKRLMKLTLSLLALACGNASATDCHAQEAEDVARHCVRRVNHIVDRCTNAVADTTHECVREVNRLLEAGEEQAARRVARGCIEEIQNITDACIEAIEEICVRCVNVLINEYGAERLAARVRYNCADALAHVVSLETRAINLIKDQFA